MPTKINFNIPFDEAVKYFEKKGLKLSYNYHEIWQEAHNKAFTVAKITRVDLLSDLQDSILEAINSGKGFSQWKKEIKPTLQKYGWYGKVNSTNPKTGETKEIHVGSRRLKTIYDTNIRMSYQNGRYKQANDFEDRLYWRYNSKLLENTRDSHRHMHGIVFHRDHSFWDKNMPMCDYNCKCFLTFHTKEECEQNGWSISTAIYPDIAKNGFDYNKRYKTWNGGGISKIHLDDSIENLPILKQKDKYHEWSEEKLKTKFFKDFGVGKNGGIFIDKIGDILNINDDLFKSSSGFNKIKKRQRHLFIDEFSKLIKDPDEIYLELEYLRELDMSYMYPNHRIVKKFFRYYKDDKGKLKALVAMFSFLKDKTQGVTLYYIDKDKTVVDKRIGKLIYRKD